MKIIAVVSQKGGVGKSTLVLNLALYFGTQGVGVDVADADADAQGSLTAAANLLTGLTFVKPGDVWNRQVENLDLIVVDTSPRNDVDLTKILTVADFVLIPVRPGFFDVLAVKDTVALLAQAQVNRPELKAGIVLTMVQQRTAVTREVLSMLETFPVETLPVMIYNRVAYTRSAMTNGILGSNDPKAYEEITDLATAIIDRL